MKALVTLACLGYIVWYFVANADELTILGDLSVWAVAALIALRLPHLLAHSARYHLVIRKCSGRPLPYPAWFRIYIVGRFLNTVVPQAGNLYRAYVLKAAHGITYTSYISAFLAFAWLGTCFDLATALVILLLSGGSVTLGGLQAEFWVSLLLVGLIGGPLAGLLFSHRINVPLRLVHRVKEKLEEILGVVVRTALDATYLVTFFGLSAGLLGVVYAVFYIGFAALGIAARPEQILLFFVLLQMVSYLNLTPSSIGVQEITFGLLGRLMGIGMGEAILVSVLLRATGSIALFSVAIPMGAIGEFVNRKAWRDHVSSSAR